MGLFDKIKDNAKAISMRALYEDVPEEEYQQPIEAIEQFSETPTEDQPVAVEAEAVKEQAPETPAKVEEKKPEPKETAKEKPAPAAKPKVTKAAIKSPAPTAKPAQKTPVDPGSSHKKVIDVAPHRPQETVKKAIYARERAAFAALATQRRLNGTVPLYTATHLSFKTRVFIDRIEYSGSFGKNVLPINQIAWIKLRSGGTGVILETVAGKRVVMVVQPKDRLGFAEAIMKVQTMQPKRQGFKDTKTLRIDQLDKMGEGVDEIEKLAKLFDKGILSQEEFDQKKRQILGL